MWCTYLVKKRDRKGKSIKKHLPRYKLGINIAPGPWNVICPDPTSLCDLKEVELSVKSSYEELVYLQGRTCLKLHKYLQSVKPYKTSCKMHEQSWATTFKTQFVVHSAWRTPTHHPWSIALRMRYPWSVVSLIEWVQMYQAVGYIYITTSLWSVAKQLT